MRTLRELVDADRRHIWHPYASTTVRTPLHLVTDAAGVRIQLTDDAGPHWVIDGMSSWWCMIHGYRNPVLDAALHTQVDQFAHVMFGGLTHQPAIQLVEALIDLAPRGLDRVFLADSGSVAMEVALKLARQTQISRSPAGVGARVRRTKLAALRGGYHGDTLGAMSVCDPVGGMHAMFADSIPAQVFLPRPPAFATTAAEVEAWAAAVSSLIHDHRDELAGIVVEPILQGAGGMWSYAPAALQVLRDLADQYQLVFIADEIATGFGRTGKLWACEWAGIAPDIMVVGKALTGGYLTQAAVLCCDELAREISDGPGGALMHGPTFMANPLACAVSLASVGLVADGAWCDDVARIETVLAQELLPLNETDGVADVRVLGATAVVEMNAPFDLAAATNAALERGVWLRPFRNLIYAMPPYLCTEDELRTIAAGMKAAVAVVREN